MRSNPKEFVVLTYGTRGDVQPFVALGAGLQHLGYNVRIAAPEDFGDLITGHSLDFAPLPGDPGILAKQLVEYAGLNPIRMVKAVSEFVLPLAAQALVAARAACNDASAIIHSFLMTEAGNTIADELGIPSLSGQFFPIFSTTGDFPSMTFPNLPLGKIYRRATHELTTSIFRYSGRFLYAFLRRRHNELSKLSAWPFSRNIRHKTPILYAFSPNVIQPPKDWPSSSIVTGYWSLDPPKSWRPPDQIADFLAGEPSPIYIGLGSIPPRQMVRFREVFAQAIQSTNQRAILSTKDKNSYNFDSSAQVLFVDNIPHSWLFPRMKAIVHHGGAGTTGAGLSAGVPNIVIPFTADQAFWGSRVHQLGAGPAPIHNKQLTAERLINAINTTISNQGIRVRAKRLGELIRQEDGIGKAVEIISKHIGAASQYLCQNDI